MKKWLRYSYESVKLYVLYKIWASTNSSLIHQYVKDKWHERAMQAYVDYISRVYKDAHKGSDSNTSMLFAGVIYNDWIDRIDAVIAKKKKEELEKK
jgi:uncharacterized protein YacL (UPF0231 family)